MIYRDLATERFPRGRDRRLRAPDRAPARSRCIVAHDAAGFEHIAAVGDGQRQRGHLVDQQDGHAVVAQFGEHVEQFVDHRRRQAERRLVEQQDARLRHQAAGDGQHLLLAAGEKPGAAGQPLAQPRKALEQRLELGLAIDILSRVGAEQDVVAARSAPETPAGPPAPAPRRCAAISCARASARSACRRARSSRSTGRSRPVTARIAVDLPAPLAPSSATISPGLTSNETSSSTGAAP